MKWIVPCCFSFVLMMVFVGCSDKEGQKNYQLLKSLNASVEHATAMMAVSVYQYEKEWAKREDDPVYTDIYSAWYPKLADLISKSKEIKTDIDIIKKEVFTKKDSAVGNQLEAGKAKDLYKKLLGFREQALAIDSFMAEDLWGKERRVLLTRASFDTSINKGDFTEAFFNDMSPLGAVANLSQFQYNIMTLTNEVLRYSILRTNIPWCGYFDYDNAIAVISSTHIRAGEQIEVTAGMGAFSTVTKPIISINGKVVSERSPEGSTIAAVKASTVPGKHIIPVRIDYTDRYKRPATVEKKLVYYVDSIPMKP